MPVTVVTGAGGEIGRAIAVALASAGHRIVAADVQEATALATVAAVEAAGGKALACTFDVADLASGEAALDTAERALGPIEVFVNNAGISGEVAPIGDYDPDIFDEVMRVNVRGVFAGTRHALSRMLPREKGAVINIASTSAIRGRANLCAYVASKHAVLGLTRSAALEARSSGVRVNAVLPGPVEGTMIEGIEARARNLPGGIGRSTQARRALPAEVASVVVFLASDASSHVNGAAWVVDGGSTIV